MENSMFLFFDELPWITPFLLIILAMKQKISENDITIRSLMKFFEDNHGNA